MVIIVRKTSLLLVALVVLLSVALYSINFSSAEEPAIASNGATAEKLVVIDPGHGGEDPGAVSDYNHVSEKNINLYIGLKVRELLENEGFKVIMTRTEDRLEYREGTKGPSSMREQDLNRRKKLMDESGAGAVVSIHLNKFEQPKYHGAQVFFPKDPEDSQRLAISLQQSLKEVVEPGNSREALIKRDPLIILKNAKVPTAIVECGFLSNAEEEKKLADQTYQDTLAEAIKQGIVKYFNGNGQ